MLNIFFSNISYKIYPFYFHFFTNLIICISCFTIFCRYFIAEYIYTNKLDELFLCLYNFLFKHIK